VPSSISFLILIFKSNKNPYVGQQVQAYSDGGSPLLKTTQNLKHKTLLMTAYSAGLRVSELVNLKVFDIDSKRMTIHVRRGKGKKDRMVPLSKLLLEVLREYYKAYHPREYLFKGEGGRRYRVGKMLSIDTTI
jgi:integrase